MAVSPACQHGLLKTWSQESTLKRIWLATSFLNPPAPKVLRACINNCKVQVYLRGDLFFGQNQLVIDRSQRRTSKNTFVYSTEWTSSCMRPPGTGKRKVTTTVFFTFGLRFSVLRRVFFHVSCREAGPDFVISELFG